METDDPKNISSPTVETEHCILLVDDNEANKLVAGLMLEMLGYIYETASNGAEAVQRFKNKKYDIIFMDLQMPEVDGIEASNQIRKIEAERHLERTPIVALTASVTGEYRIRCDKTDMDDFIPKPFTSGELDQTIKKYVSENGSRS